MRQFTNKSQTAKLIELGFEKPKSEVECELPKGDWRIGSVGIRKAYSIGELIEMLPKRVGVWDLEIACDSKFERWLCFLNPDTQCGIATELVDALYNLLIQLKEEGVI